jgi:hypothetical protein
MIIPFFMFFMGSQSFLSVPPVSGFMHPGRFPVCENIIPMNNPRINDDLRHLPGVIFPFPKLFVTAEGI